MPESEQPRFHFGIVPLALAPLAGFLLLTSFSDRVRKLIKQRDNNQSVLSGKTEHLECAHLNHNRGYSKYNDASNGRLLTVDEHYIDHYDRAGRNGLPIEQNNWALRTIWNRMDDDERQLVMGKGYEEP